MQLRQEQSITTTTNIRISSMTAPKKARKGQTSHHREESRTPPSTAHDVLSFRRYSHIRSPTRLSKIHFGQPFFTEESIESINPPATNSPPPIYQFLKLKTLSSPLNTHHSPFPLLTRHITIKPSPPSIIT